MFAASNPNKSYKGFYKTKNKQKYDKQREELNRNSSVYIKKIDQSIEE